MTALETTTAKLLEAAECENLAAIEEALAERSVAIQEAIAAEPSRDLVTSMTAALEAGNIACQRLEALKRRIAVESVKLGQVKEGFAEPEPHHGYRV